MFLMLLKSDVCKCMAMFINRVVLISMGLGRFGPSALRGRGCTPDFKCSRSLNGLDCWIWRLVMQI